MMQDKRAYYANQTRAPKLHQRSDPSDRSGHPSFSNSERSRGEKKKYGKGDRPLILLSDDLESVDVVL